jgi:signal transduction histidine kinase
VDLVADLRTRTTLVCGALALAIAVSALLRGKVRKTHALFAAFAADVGLWYLSQSLFGFFQAPIWERLRIVLAVPLPVFAVNLFEAMVPDEDPARRWARVGRLSLFAAVPMVAIALSPAIELTWARVVIFAYEFAVIAAGLWELGQRGLHSRSRAIQRRVRFLVTVGALAGLFSVADFVWIIGYEPAYDPPPVGVVLSIVFLFMLAQALRHERLLDLYELLGRTLVATAVAFLIAFVFYLLVAVIGQINTMWLNAIVVAIVVLVLFNPLRDWVEVRIQRFVFRERRKLESSMAVARRRLAHTLEVDELGKVVMGALEESRCATTAALYLLLHDGSTFEQIAVLGTKAPVRIEAATAHALLERVEQGTVVLEQIVREDASRVPAARGGSREAVLAAAEVLGELKRHAVVFGIRGEEGELVGLLVVADDRIGDSFSPEDIALLEGLASQISVVVENSQQYAKLKEHDRLAVLGQMAAGLAHEIRNPLGAIKGAAQLLSDPDSSDDESAQEFLGIILEEVERLDAVVGSVLDLARQSDDVVAPIDANAVVRRTLQIMSAEWPPEAVVVETELDDDLPRVAIAPDQLRQVMINLLRNAVQAMKGSGRVVVRTRAPRRRGALRSRSDGETALAPEPWRQPARQEGGWVGISVTDDGPGMAPSQLKSIFLPFYTTKAEGTGLGLAICQRIAQRAGGRIEVRSRLGEGTTFDLLLPAAMEALGTPRPGVSASARPSKPADSAAPPVAIAGAPRVPRT